MKTVELVGMPSATARIARELEANGVRVFVRDSTKPHEVAKPVSDVDLVVLLGANGLGSAVRDAAKQRGIDCVSLPYDWTRARPILEAKGVLAMGYRPLEKVAVMTKEVRCACGRLPLHASGLTPLPDGSVHGEKQCQMLPVPAAEKAPDPAPTKEEASREAKIEWARAEALRDPKATPTAIARRTRAHFGVGADSHTICDAVREARGEKRPVWKRGTRGDVRARRRAAEQLFEEDPTQSLEDVLHHVRAQFGTGVTGATLATIRDRVLRRAERTEQKPALPVPKAEVLSAALREAIEAVKVAGATEGLHRLVLDFDASGVVTVSWERAIVRSGKATL